MKPAVELWISRLTCWHKLAHNNGIVTMRIEIAAFEQLSIRQTAHGLSEGHRIFRSSTAHRMQSFERRCSPNSSRASLSTLGATDRS